MFLCAWSSKSFRVWSSDKYDPKQRNEVDSGVIILSTIWCLIWIWICMVNAVFGRGLMIRITTFRSYLVLIKQPQKKIPNLLYSAAGIAILWTHAMQRLSKLLASTDWGPPQIHLLQWPLSVRRFTFRRPTAIEVIAYKEYAWMPTAKLKIKPFFTLPSAEQALKM